MTPKMDRAFSVPTHSNILYRPYINVSETESTTTQNCTFVTWNGRTWAQVVRASLVKGLQTQPERETSAAATGPYMQVLTTNTLVALSSSRPHDRTNDENDMRRRVVVCIRANEGQAVHARNDARSRVRLNHRTTRLPPHTQHRTTARTRLANEVVVSATSTHNFIRIRQATHIHVSPLSGRRRCDVPCVVVDSVVVVIVHTNSRVAEFTAVKSPRRCGLRLLLFRFHYFIYNSNIGALPPHECFLHKGRL